MKPELFAIPAAANVTDLMRQFPALPPRLIVTLAIMEVMARNVTPRKACQCGCGSLLTGKQHFASVACRQRALRQRRAAAAALKPARQFHLVFQFELPIKSG